MTIAGRSSYIRMWVLVTSYTPLRAYLFKGGFAIFGKAKGSGSNRKDAAAAASHSAVNNTISSNSSTSSNSSSSTDDLVVNLWIQDRSTSVVWSLEQLEQYFIDHPEEMQAAPRPTNSKERRLQGTKTSSSANSSSGDAGSSSSSSSGSSGGFSSANKSSSSNRQGAGVTATARSDDSAPSAAAAGGGDSVPQHSPFDSTWSHLINITSLALAAAIPSMRSEAAELGAPPQGPFEFFGLDFVFDAGLKPWLLEVNAVPSLARRKRSGCTGDRSSSTCQLSNPSSSSSSSSNGSSSAAAEQEAVADGFDAQKELFVHDMLALLGLPVDDGDTPTAAAAADGGGGGGGSGALPPLPPALAAAIASRAPGSGGNGRSAEAVQSAVGKWLQQLKGVEVLEVLGQVADSSRSATAAGREGDGDSNGAAAFASKAQTAGAAAGGEGVTAAAGAGLLPGAAGTVGGGVRGLRKVRAAGAGGVASARLQRRRAAGHGHGHASAKKGYAPHHRPQHQQQEQQQRQQHGAALPAFPSASSAAGGVGGGCVKQQQPQQQPVVLLQEHLPRELQQLFCNTEQRQDKGAAATVKAMGSRGSDGTVEVEPDHAPTATAAAEGAGEGFACVKCLLALDLHALADTERELGRLGRFLPVFDVIPAYQLNAAGSASEAGQEGGVGKQGWRGLRGVEMEARGLSGALSGNNETLWGQMQKAWVVYSQDGGGLSGLGAAMKVMSRDNAGIEAVRDLKLVRQDYVVSAWLRLRKKQRQGQLEGRGSPKWDMAVSDGQLRPADGGLTLALLKDLTSRCHIDM